ncbi:MAG: hypothetical protein PHO10_11690 [Gemmiger sp.]|nr:hypothetical protein [Gemmiger sp.]
MKKRNLLLYTAALAAVAIGLAACRANTTPTPTATPQATAAPTPTPAPEAPNTPEEAPGGADNQAPAAPAPDEALAETLDAIYAAKDTGLMLATQPVDLADAGWVKYYTGLDAEAAAKLDAAVASEAAIGSQAYSVVLARVKDPADAAATAQAMLDGIDPRKWVCVQADDLRAAASGDTVLLVLVDSQLADAVTAEEVVTAFTEVMGGTLDTDLTRTIEID